LSDLLENDAINLHAIGKIENAKNYLESLFKMYEAVQSMRERLPPKWPIEFHGKLHDKVEMPKEWYSKMHAAAYPNIQGEHKLSEEMLYMRVKLLLAKTLLVYERLNKFYK
jgi:hypothetical protein